MKRSALITAGAFALTLAACGEAQDTTPADTMAGTDMPMDGHDNAAMDHAMAGDTMEHDMAGMGDGIGHATGTIRSVGSEGDFLTIEHGPFEGGIEMGAMTMGFDTMGDVDLSGFAEGDEVAFRVKQGRDGSYRIMAICDTAAGGAECLDAITE